MDEAPRQAEGDSGEEASAEEGALLWADSTKSKSSTQECWSF